MIRILIADDHAIVRGGLKQIVATTTDIVAAGEATHGAEVIDKVRQAELDLLLLDMTMPGLSGVDLVRRVRTDKPGLPILVLSMHNEGQVVSRALRAGATGYVTKDSDPAILLAAIRKVAAGGRFIDPALVDAIVFDAGNGDRPPHDLLSDREFQVLQKIVAGEAIGEIGAALNLSAKTISTHKMRLMQKIGVDNNADLIRYALRHGLAQE
ncbi:MAG: response regulator transcription factor [Burkholderiales bacterium]|jgi:DNA-binding NarL/FixJ family response regulator|nr:response regulator transcription factor [Rhodocyclaceae bacterium]MCZ2174329.1 response regulator transcription factor [Burkholderiales bacterium]OQY70100.1 MAG: DNA-binding response regulator [Rhodocyclaceae bacterium UTPRO2]HNQ58582.1 response regulator transcription factor [Candidatus Desulfobacillus denitrificans]MBV6411791.1 Response regulator UvrY [Rhodocyclaceae bacterium]